MNTDLEKLVGDIDKTFGKGHFFKGNDSPREDIKKLSSGSILLDEALGGGYPEGRIIEIYGNESSGKTTLTLHAIAEAQKAGGLAAFIDAEHALDLEYAEKLGVNVDELFISQPDNGEQALEIADKIVDSGQFKLVVIDSVAALTPKAEIEGDMGDNKMGLQARLMSQACRKLTGKISKTDTILIFINQIRHKIGVMFGSPETTTGGNALKFYASQRLEIRKKGQLKDSDDSVMGHDVIVKIVKNKVAPPFRVANTKLIYGKGISLVDEIIDIGTELNIIDKKGSWYSYEGSKLGQGLNNVREIFYDNPELVEEIMEKIKEA